MAISLGDSPDRLTVKLSRFGDFVAADARLILAFHEWQTQVGAG